MLCIKDALRQSALALLASVGSASAQGGGSPPKTPLEWAARATRAHGTAHPMTRVDVVEAEPNNTIATSTAVSLGDNASGAISPVGDLDYYAVTVTAGTVLVVEVSAARQGSTLDSQLFLVSPGGIVLAINDNALDKDSRIRFLIPTTGRYFVAIRDVGLRGGAGFTYSLTFRAAAAAPGDPTTLFASRLGLAWAAAAGPGVLYVADWTEGRILRIAADGQSTVFATGLGDVYT